MTIYHALKCNGGYETFAYDLFGTLRFFSFSKTLEFLSKSRLTEKSCDRLCNRLNAELKRHKEDKDNFIVAIEKAKQCLAAGEKPEDVFDYCGDFNEEFAAVKLNGKRNLIDHKGKLISDTWFDWCGSFHEGFARVFLNHKWNYIDHEGKYLSDTWFDDGWYFNEGFSLVKLNDKCNFIDRNGKLLSDTWFDDCEEFIEGFAVVELNGIDYLLSKDGTLCDFDTKEPIKMEE